MSINGFEGARTCTKEPLLESEKKSMEDAELARVTSLHDMRHADVISDETIELRRRERRGC